MAAIGRLTQVLQRFAPASRAESRGNTRRPQTARRNEAQQIAALAARWMAEIDEHRQAMPDAQRLGQDDRLTGLFNRSYLDLLTAKLGEAQSPSAGSLMELCVFCVDLDHFKPVNDDLGQPAGDEVLRQVAARLKRTARQDQDVVLRLGGDEFLLLLPCPIGQGSAIAQSIANRIMVALQPPIVWLTTVELRIGASIGAAVWRPGRGPLSAVIGQADEALFAAKRAGRGRFRRYSVGLKSAWAEPLVRAS